MRRPYSLPLVVSFTVVVLLLAACSGSSDESADTTLAATTTTVASTETTEAPVTTTTSATTTTTAPAATAPTSSQDVLLTFDGEQCTYQGPSEGVLSELLNLEIINNSDVQAVGAVVWVPPDLLEEVMPTVGTDFPYSAAEKGMHPTFYVDVQPGTEASLASVFVSTPGTYVLDCLSAEGATMVHVWRPAAIEFSP